MSALEPVTAAGGVIFRHPSGKPEPEVLLIYRRKVWDLPKGKLEEGESVKGCAVREVAEEIGITEEPHIVSELTDTYHEYDQNQIHFGKTTHWYAMELASNDDDFQPQYEEGIEQVKWHTLAMAKRLVGYQNLVSVLELFESWYNNKA